jgi:putative glycosyltransferase (TIGR04372 family)
MNKEVKKVLELILFIYHLMQIKYWQFLYGDKIILGIIRTDIFGHLTLHGNRIGYFSKIDSFFTEFDKVILLTDKEICNEFLLKYIKNILPKNFLIKKSRWPFKKYRRFYFDTKYEFDPKMKNLIFNFEKNFFTFPDNNKSNYKVNRINEMTMHEEINSINQKNLDRISNPESIKRAMNIFKIQSHDKVALIIDRDQSYHGGLKSPRDTDFKLLEFICRYLLELNYIVIRIGDKRVRQLDLGTNKFIDYSFVKNKSEEYQFLLSNRADVVFSWTTGLYHLPQIQNKKVCIVDDIYFTPLSPNILTNPRKYKLLDEPITIGKLINESWFNLDEGDPFDSFELYSKYGISYAPMNFKNLKSVVDQALGVKKLNEEYLHLESRYLQELVQDLKRKASKGTNMNLDVYIEEIENVSNVVALDFLDYYKTILFHRT